jgi:hypothetical protein
MYLAVVMWEKYADRGLAEIVFLTLTDTGHFEFIHFCGPHEIVNKVNTPCGR